MVRPLSYPVKRLSLMTDVCQKEGGDDSMLSLSPLLKPEWSTHTTVGRLVVTYGHQSRCTSLSYSVD